MIKEISIKKIATYDNTGVVFSGSGIFEVVAEMSIVTKA
jgi:hypothetical protein